MIKEIYMMESLRKQLENSCYWDARVKVLECNYFGDEVKLIYEDEDNENDISYSFSGCYLIKIEHVMTYRKDKPSKELTVAQIPYFIQRIDFDKMAIEGKDFLKFRINMYPIELLIVCEKITIDKGKPHLQGTQE